VRSRADAVAYLAGRFACDYPDWARGAGTWPLRVPLHPPTPGERSADPVACHAWAAEWDHYDGPGAVEAAPLRFPTGTHPMPRALVLARPHDAAAVTPATAAAWRRCGQRLTSLQAAFPNARFDRIIRRLAEMDDGEFRRLEATTAWLRDNPASGMLLRQLPIEGIGTKWLMAHAGLVLPLLGDPDPAIDDASQDDHEGDDTPASLRRRLHERLGLRVPPALVQVTVLDPAIRARIGGMRHLAASVEDLTAWDVRPRVIVILENKETAYAIPGDQPGTIVFHGHGFSVLNYARISWVRSTPDVIYWGDIDGPGLEFVSTLRGHGIPARTILTDTATLDAWQHLAIDGAPPGREPPGLTAAEAALHARLAAHHAATGSGLLLEQERIPWDHAWRHLATAIATAGEKDGAPPLV
jgi:hypothetical protein